MAIAGIKEAIKTPEIPVVTAPVQTFYETATIRLERDSKPTGAL